MNNDGKINLKLVAMLQKGQDNIRNEIERLKKDLEAYNQLLRTHIGDEDSGRLCNVPGCNVERDIESKTRMALCRKHRLEKQREYVAKHYKNKPHKEEQRAHYAKNLKSESLAERKKQLSQRKKKLEEDDIFVEESIKGIRQQMFKKVPSPNEEEAAKLIKQAKDNE